MSMKMFTKEEFAKAWNDNLDDFLGLIQIPSVYDEKSARPGQPFGKPVNDALCYMRSLCEREGFVIKEYDGYAFSASYGEGERIDLVSHLDVVAVDGEWQDNPFSGARRDGRIYGRGTQDMKSGAFLTFLALKMLKDSGVMPTHEIRLVYGTDEERTMEDMRYYVEKAGLPAFAFSPDGCFPMAIGEKGALMWIMEGDFKSLVDTLEIGIQPNVVPPCAKAKVGGAEGKNVAKAEEVGGAGGEKVAKAEEVGGAATYVTEGKAAHASRPELGESAGTKLYKLLYEKTGEAIWKRLYDAFSNPFGAGCGFDSLLPKEALDADSNLTLNPGKVTFSNPNHSLGHFEAMIDCRYPMGVSSKDLTDKLAALFPDFTVTLPYDDVPTMADPNSPYIEILTKAYEGTTGRACKPIVSGGVSYSKVFGNCVTFGTVAEDSEMLAHQKDESIAERDCLLALEIYSRVLAAL